MYNKFQDKNKTADYYNEYLGHEWDTKQTEEFKVLVNYNDLHYSQDETSWHS